MDLRKIFAVTQKIDILVDDPETSKRRIYYSRIEDVHNDTLVIGAPYSQGFYLPPRIGRELSARVTSDACAYFFKTRLRGYVHEPIPLWTIAMPVDIERVQMRSFVRLGVNLDVTLTVIDPDKPVTTITTITKDISAGGLRVLLAQPMPPETKLDITLPLEEGSVVQATGELVRVIMPEREHDKYELAIKYSKIDERARNLIVKYIFKKQVERRKKEIEIFAE
ncbi:MAG: flagellar brake domain-containing protein [Negativicutes bacterium]|nr:flagellar brake domain-containing protein [Negativicutes bacterium]